MLKEWNQAIENSKSKVAPVQQEEKKFSLGKAGREFENEELYNFIEETEAGKVGNWEHFTINETVSERLIKDVKELLGIDITGYTNEIVPDDIRHIFKRHGENGTADQSMKDYHDIAKVPYVIENYDHIKVGRYSKGRRNSDGTKARTIVLSKKIDDLFYYVVEVVPDSKVKKIFLQSTYANKNDTYSQARNVKNPTHNVQNEAESDVSFDNSISRNEENATEHSITIVRQSPFHLFAMFILPAS